MKTIDLLKLKFKAVEFDDKKSVIEFKVTKLDNKNLTVNLYGVTLESICIQLLKQFPAKKDFKSFLDTLNKEIKTI